jgi:hypothetical protein
MIDDHALLGLIEPKLYGHLRSQFSTYEPDYFDACVVELLKFLFLSSKYAQVSTSFIPVTREIDEFWHAIILQTNAYEQLCKKLPGHAMIHHESLAFDDYRGGINKRELVDEILRWLVLYVRNFGEMKRDRLKHWFFINMVHQSQGISLGELNHQAMSDTYFMIAEPKDGADAPR